MNKKCIILPLLLVLLSIGLSMAEEDGNESASQTAAANESVPANESAETLPATPNLNYIWSFSGIEAGPITMAINQDGSDLFGQANYQPEGGVAWNAEVVGSVEENTVELTMTAQKDKELVTTKMTGLYADDTINGNFTQFSGGQKVGSGTFSALWISPDTSGYTPAVIEEEEEEPVTPAAVNTTTDATSDQTTQDTKSRFVDVRTYKDKIGPGGDLSGIPPGMGGSGLN